MYIFLCKYNFLRTEKGFYQPKVFFCWLNIWWPLVDKIEKENKTKIRIQSFRWALLQEWFFLTKVTKKNIDFHIWNNTVNIYSEHQWKYVQYMFLNVSHTKPINEPWNMKVLSLILDQWSYSFYSTRGQYKISTDI